MLNMGNNMSNKSPMPFGPNTKDVHQIELRFEVGIVVVVVVCLFVLVVVVVIIFVVKNIGDNSDMVVMMVKVMVIIST